MTHFAPCGSSVPQRLGWPALNGGMRWMTGVRFSLAPATSAAPTAGRSGSVDRRRCVAVAVQVDLAEAGAERDVVGELGAEAVVEVGGLGADAAADAGAASRWPARPGRMAGATSAWVPSMAPTTGRAPVRASIRWRSSPTR